MMHNEIVVETRVFLHDFLLYYKKWFLAKYG